MLAKTAKKELPDIILVQEPYVKDNKIEGLPVDNITNKANVTESLKDILSNRKVIIQTQESPAIWQQTKGCAQSSCSGPAFWNLVADNILKTDWPQNVHLQAFAADFAFVISHKTKDGVQQLANRAITTFSNWAELNKLQISLERTKYMYLGNLINPARIKWNNTRNTKSINSQISRNYHRRQA
ncbi:hypothetical protein AVEN_46028-1 [Araneus ventricosus]|uniref:Uncharacterized protein n=1 Tax=Araneus ventricosus TaxID=182803 RepID=A0A4Y2M138_ARAVE|nr:hypothetical protein AVEN_46028-1 [Araneus ventricosus]